MLGIGIALGAGYWLLHGIQFGPLFEVLRDARPGFLILVPVSVLAEQWVRAWKWRWIVAATCTVPTRWAFRALLAGYLPGLWTGFGTSALVRSWLLARRSGQPTSTMLATSSVDRLIDAFAFSAFAGLAAAWVQLPASQARLSQGLRWAGVLILVAALLALFLLLGVRHGLTDRTPGLVSRLPSRWRGWIAEAASGYSHGLVWPRSLSRRAAIVGAAFLIKLIATTQYLWAGLAFGVLLRPGDYVFIMVFLGTLMVLAFFVPVPGSGLLASLFVLELFGVDKNRALAVTLAVAASFLATLAIGGGIAWIREGVGPGRLPGSLRRTRPVPGSVRR